MSTQQKIRHITKNEWKDFLRFLERSYGFGNDYFKKFMPHIFIPQTKYFDCFYVLEVNNRIVSNVGLFPLTVHLDKERFTMGVIGSVATLPEHRGRGYMKTLLNYVIGQMEKEKTPVSVLWGDRQRYGRFGWETAGEKARIRFTKKGLMDYLQENQTVTQVNPLEGTEIVKILYNRGSCWIERKNLKELLSKRDNRIWICKNGYLCGNTSGRTLIVSEVFSGSGDELSLMASVMEWCFVESAQICLSMADNRLEKFIDSCASWELVHEGMFRINSNYLFLTKVKPVLQERLRKNGTDNFEIAVKIVFLEKEKIIKFAYKNGKLNIFEKEKSINAIEITWREWTRFLLGGPLSINTRNKLKGLSCMFPIYIHIPVLDHA